MKVVSVQVHGEVVNGRDQSGFPGYPELQQSLKMKPPYHHNCTTVYIYFTFITLYDIIDN